MKQATGRNIKTFKLESLTYNELVTKTRSAYGEHFSKQDKIVTYWKNNANELTSFHSDAQLKEIIKHNCAVYIRKFSLDLPEQFYI